MVLPTGIYRLRVERPGRVGLRRALLMVVAPHIFEGIKLRTMPLEPLNEGDEALYRFDRVNQTLQRLDVGAPRVEEAIVPILGPVVDVGTVMHTGSIMQPATDDPQWESQRVAIVGGLPDEVATWLHQHPSAAAPGWPSFGVSFSDPAHQALVRDLKGFVLLARDRADRARLEEYLGWLRQLEAFPSGLDPVAVRTTRTALEAALRRYDAAHVA